MIFPIIWRKYFTGSECTLSDKSPKNYGESVVKFRVFGAYPRRSTVPFVKHAVSLIKTSFQVRFQEAVCTFPIQSDAYWRSRSLSPWSASEFPLRRPRPNSKSVGKQPA